MQSVQESDLAVAALMQPNEYPAVSENTDLAEIFSTYVLGRGHEQIIVQRNGKFVGIITHREFETTNRKQWPRLKAKHIMIPTARMLSVPPNADARETLALMQRYDMQEVLVVSDNQVVGIFRAQTTARTA